MTALAGEVSEEMSTTPRVRLSRARHLVRIRARVRVRSWSGSGSGFAQPEQVVRDRVLGRVRVGATCAGGVSCRGAPPRRWPW